MTIRAVAALFLGTFLASCAGQAGEPVLAEVGDIRIHASELRRYEARLAESLRSKEGGLAGRRQHLQALIDKQILIREAAARGWDHDPDMLRKLQREWTNRLVEEFFSREVSAKITIEEQAIHDRYLESGRNRAVRCGKIEVRSSQEAEEIVRLLEGGADFGELARQRSIHRPTAEQGGLYSGYVTRDRIPEPILQERVYVLAKGQITEALSLPGGTYGVFTVADEMAVPLEQVRSVVESELRREKVQARSAEIATELWESLHARPREDGFEFVLTRLETEGVSFSEAERGMVMYEFDGGTVTVGEFVDSARENHRPFAREIRDQVKWFAESILVPRALLVQAARNIGIDRDPELVAWRRAREEERLLVVIRKAVTVDTQVEDAEARRFYERNMRLFVPQETMTLDEILVAGRDDAVALRNRIERGEDLRGLAQQHSLRRAAIPDSGRFHLHWFEREAHEALFEAARGAAPGDLLGPVEVEMATHEVASRAGAAPADRYYSLFRVVESTLGADPRPFDEVAPRARALVRRRKRDAAFFRFMGELRQQYEPQVRVHEENLRALVEQESG